MNSSNDLNTVEILDDIDNLLFLCDRLGNRLSQITTYVDEVKQAWTTKRGSIDLDSNMSPIIAQKVSKYNRVLLNVAEKLAVVELQTESLHNLQSSITNTVPNPIEKREVRSSIPSFQHIPTNPRLSSVQITHARNESNGTEFPSQRDMPSGTEFLIRDQCAKLGIRTPLHVSINVPTSAFTTRNTSALVNEPISEKQSIEQQQSGFRRPFPGQENIGFNQQKATSQKPFISQTTPKSLQNGLTNGYQQQSFNSGLPTPSTLSDSYSSGMLNESNGINNKVRVKMQVIKAGVIWQNADIPIIDHPSAFFVCNQDPRVAEQFNMMSMEMNNYYNKPANTTMFLRNPSIGDFCVARFSEDQNWYRARVVLIHNNESILIVFIDYGNSETKPANEIYPMQESLARLPAMTVACTLADSFPYNENFWTTEATEIFNHLVKNRIVEVHFQQGSCQQWPLHFVKVMLDGQSITQHPKFASHITVARNEQIAMHFNDKLTSMEYILYNVAVVESDIYNSSLP